MKKIIGIFFALFLSTSHAQTFKIQNINVAGATTLATPPTVPGACSNILSYGGSAGGVAANDAAFTSAIAASVAVTPGQACVYFPAGRYKFLSQAVYTVPSTSYSSVSIIGAGSENTVLTWPATAGLKINLSSQYNIFHIRAMTLTTGTTNAGSGVLINQTSSPIANAANAPLGDLTDVTLRGDDGAGNFDYWTNAVEIVNQSNINLLNVVVTGTNTHQGTGLLIHGNEADPPNVFNVTGSTFNYLNVGIEYGDYVQGLTVSQSNFTGCNFGINTQPNLHILVQLSVNNSQFNCFMAGLNFATEIPDTTINGNLFFVPGPSSGVAIGVNMIRSHRYSITGNSFTAYNTTANSDAIVIGTSVAAGVITGNSFNAVAFGVVLQAPSTGNNVQSNAYSSVGTAVSNAGTGNTVGGGSQ